MGTTAWSLLLHVCTSTPTLLTIYASMSTNVHSSKPCPPIPQLAHPLHPYPSLQKPVHAVRQVIQTFQVAAELGNQSLGAYVISMAHSASDVLAVELLQREALLTVGGTRFTSSKPVGRHAVSPVAASANAGATVNGNVSAPFLVPSSVHSAKAVNLQASVVDASAESTSASGVLCSCVAECVCDASAESAPASGVLCSCAAKCVCESHMLSSSVVTGQLCGR